MANGQSQVKQIQAMMGKYLTEISEVKTRLQKLEETVEWLYANVAFRDRSGEDE